MFFKHQSYGDGEALASLNKQEQLRKLILLTLHSGEWSWQLKVQMNAHVSSLLHMLQQDNMALVRLMRQHMVRKPFAIPQFLSNNVEPFTSLSMIFWQNCRVAWPPLFSLIGRREPTIWMRLVLVNLEGPWSWEDALAKNHFLRDKMQGGTLDIRMCGDSSNPASDVAKPCQVLSLLSPDMHSLDCKSERN